MVKSAMVRLMAVGGAVVITGGLAGMSSLRPAATQNVPLQSVQSWPAEWSYNPYALDAEVFSVLTDLPLAYRTRPNGAYIPLLATSWHATKTALTVQLRPGATWQNGKPVTSTDVKDSFLIGGAFGWSAWDYINNIQTPNSHEVVFSIDPGVSIANVEEQVMGSDLVPSSVYGRFISAGLKAAILKNNLQVLTALKTRVEDYSPPTLISDGPYRITAMNTAEAILSKWSGFYGAKQVHVNSIEMYNTSSPSAAANLMFSGKDDYSWQTLTSTTLAEWNQQPDSHVHYSWDMSQWGYYFNDKDYPLNIVGVRQALVYATNRVLLDHIATGDVVKEGVYEPYITGLHSTVLDRWVPASVIKSLNPYPYDPAKATKILESLHFKKTASGWVMPNGKPFTLNLTSPEGYGGPQLSTETWAQALTQFGIKASAQTVEQPGYWLQQNKGQYQISWGWSAFYHLNPINSFNGELVGENYTPDIAGYVGMGFGPTVKVPGIGTVDITKNLIADANLTAHAAIQKVAVGYAKLINEDLPFFTYGQKELPIEYTTTNYGDWPPNSNPLWLQAGGNADGALALMLMAGYIRPN